MFVVKLCLILCFSWLSLCFSCPSHVMIYIIARNNLPQDIVNKIDDLIFEMKEKDSTYKTKEEVACWPDDLKTNEFLLFSGWHYFDQPFLDGVDPKQVHPYIPKNYNALYTVIEAISTLKSVPQKQFDGKFEKSFMLRMLIHLIGDIHMPLHMISRYTPSLPDGDGGGNKFPINFTFSTKNLHALWDQGMGNVPFYTRPYTSTSISKLKSLALNISYENPRSSLKEDLAIKDYWVMGNNTFKDAINYAYNGIKENEVPSDDYLNRGWARSKRLMALAAYRLEDALLEIFAS